MFERLKREEERRLGRPLTSREINSAVYARTACRGGQKTQKRAMRRAIRYGH